MPSEPLGLLIWVVVILVIVLIVLKVIDKL